MRKVTKEDVGILGGAGGHIAALQARRADDVKRSNGPVF